MDLLKSYFLPDFLLLLVFVHVCLSVRPAVSTLKFLHFLKLFILLFVGKEVTRGLGAGGVPDNGRKAAEESRAEIMKYVLGLIPVLNDAIILFYINM